MTDKTPGPAAPRERTNEGHALRVRPDSFADHYSQARLFSISKTPVEQKHLSDALTFELSKVETPAIRARIGRPLAQCRREPRPGGGAGLRHWPREQAIDQT